VVPVALGGRLRRSVTVRREGATDNGGTMKRSFLAAASAAAIGLTAAGSLPGAVLATAAATAQYP
jgi:hypothetical protein